MADDMKINTEKICDYLDLIKAQVPGSRITVILRNPDNPERDLLLGDDTMQGIYEVLGRSAARVETDIYGKPK